MKEALIGNRRRVTAIPGKRTLASGKDTADSRAVPPEEEGVSEEEERGTVISLTE